jgi:mono/diheme cytochrome c family protein
MSPGELGRRLKVCLLIFGVSLTTAACAQYMARQPYYRPLEPSASFANGTSAQEPPPGTVAQGQLQDDALLFRGQENGNLAAEFPFPVTRDVLDRGRERYTIYCVPCHGEAGTGNGLVVRRGFTRPPSFHTDQLRNAPVGHFFDVITNGFGAMPSYASQVPARDRWAIIAYIRALQLSQHATLDDVPPPARAQLESPGGQP